MAVALGAVSESHTGTTGNTSTTSFTWNHDTTGDRGIVVFVFAALSATNPVTSVTVGGVSMGAAYATATSNVSAGEPGVVNAYYLDNITQGVTTPIVVNRTNNTTIMYANAISVTALGATVPWGAVTQGGTATINPAVYAVDDGSPGTNSMRVGGAHYGGSTVPGAGTGSTTSTSLSIDFGTNVIQTVYETTPGQGSRNVGWVAAGADDFAAVEFAIREVANKTITAVEASAIAAAPVPTVVVSFNATVVAVPATSVAAGITPTIENARAPPSAGGTSVAPVPAVAITDTRYPDLISSETGLVSYWRLGETSGNALDSKDSNPGTTVTSITRNVAGLLKSNADGAASADGSVGPYVHVPYNANMNTGAQLSVEFWIKPTALDAAPVYPIARSATGNDPFFIRYYTSGDGRWEGDVYDINNVRTYITSPGGADVAAAGKLQHVVMTYDAAGTLKLYLNGVSYGTPNRTPNANVLVDTSAGIDLFSGWSHTSVSSVNGAMDEVALYNVALTQAQVQAHYSAGSGNILLSAVPAGVTSTAPVPSVALSITITAIAASATAAAPVPTSVTATTSVTIVAVPAAGVSVAAIPTLVNARAPPSAGGLSTAPVPTVKVTVTAVSARGLAAAPAPSIPQSRTITAVSAEALASVSILVPLEWLVDTFDTTIDGAIWNTFLANWVSGHVEMDLDSGGGGPQLSTVASYALAGSHILCKMTLPTFTPGDGPAVSFSVSDGFGYAVAFSWDGTNLYTYNNSGTNRTTTAMGPGTYWFRIRESGGTLYFETSTGGTSWTVIDSFATPSAFSNGVYAQWGTGATNPVANPLIIDNVNAPPVAITATSASATSAAPVPTVAIVEDATITAVAASATSTAPPPTVIPSQDASVTAVAASASAVAPSPTLAATQNSTLVAVAASASAAAPVPTTAIAESVTISAVSASGTGATPASTVVATQNITISAASASGVSGAPVPSTRVDDTITALSAGATATAPVPTVAAIQNATAVAVAAGAIASASIPALRIDETIAAPSAGGSSTAPVPTVLAERNVTLLAVAASATAVADIDEVATTSNISFALDAITVMATAPAPTVASTQNPTITAVAASATSTAPLPSLATTGTVTLSAPSAEVSAAAPISTVIATQTRTVVAVSASATAATPIPALAATQNIALNAVAASATSASPTPTVSAAVNITITALSAGAISTAPAPGLQAGTSITISALSAGAIASASPASVSTTTNRTVVAPGASATASASSPTLAGTQNQTLTAPSASALVNAPVPALTISHNQTVLAPSAQGTAAATGAIGVGISAPSARALATAARPHIEGLGVGPPIPAGWIIPGRVGQLTHTEAGYTKQIREGAIQRPRTGRVIREEIT